jgi:hypothetical protein
MTGWTVIIQSGEALKDACDFITRLQERRHSIEKNPPQFAA